MESERDWKENRVERERERKDESSIMHGMRKSRSLVKTGQKVA